jgi:hypothetical protein
MSRAARAAGPLAGVLAIAIVATIPALLFAQPSASANQPAVSSMVFDLPAGSARDRQRVEAGAREASERLGEWLGPSPASLHVVAKPWRRAAALDAATVTIDVPWRSAPETMDLESQAAFGVARQWWPALLSNAATAPIADGLAWYLQSRIVDRLYDLNFLVPAHSAAGVRTFGGTWPRTFHILPLGRTSAGLGRDEYLRSRVARASWPAPARRLPPDLTPRAIRFALAFATLEQMVGWPTLQGALRVMTDAARQQPMTRQDVEQMLGTAVGRDLSWFFPLAFDDSKTIDYAVRDLTTGEIAPCGRGPCFRTRVTVARLGAGEFTGSAAASGSAFDNGDAMELRVAFADGQQTGTRWDGRAASRVFEFDSASAAVSASIDPERLLLLDENFLNNAIRREAAPQLPVRKWVAYWMVWLEGAVLDYGMLF